MLQLNLRLLLIGVISTTALGATASASYMNDENFVFMYEESALKCSSIGSAEHVRQILCTSNDVATACPKTCGHCCEDDPNYSIIIKSGTPVGCDYISRKQNKLGKRRDNDCNSMVGDACPVACDSCKDLVPLDLATTQAPPTEFVPYIPQDRVGNWLPDTLEELDHFLTTVTNKALQNREDGIGLFIKPIADLKSLVDIDPALKNTVDQMFYEAHM